MRILLEVSGLSIGGPQSWVCDIAPALMRRGVDVQVLSFELSPPADYVLQQRLEADSVPYSRILLCGPRQEKLCKIHRALVDTGTCDVAHFNSDVFSGLIVPFAKRCGIRVRVLHSRTPNWRINSRGLRNQSLDRFFLWLARSYCTHVFGVTRDAVEAFLPQKSRRTIPRFVVPSAISYDRCSHRCRKSSRPDGVNGVAGPVLGFIGRFTASKNPGFLIKILSSLRKRQGSGHILFVGHGEEEERLRASATQSGIGQFVTFMPATADIAGVLADQIDVLVLPSDYEGTPRTVIESQACGVPVVCSMAVSETISVVPELVQRLHLEDGVDAWADRVLSAARVRVASDRIEECFRTSPLEAENQAKILLELYQRFISE